MGEGADGQGAIDARAPYAAGAAERAAPAFFDRHFGIRYPVALCTSWLLDPQLAEYLPEESNIVQFQRRFHLTSESLPGDSDILKFVFCRLDSELETLPQATALQRAVVTHLRAGRHWRVRTGWVEL